MKKRLYRLFDRPSKATGKPIYYVRYRSPEECDLPARSVAKLAEDMGVLYPSEPTEDDIIKICELAISRGLAYKNVTRKDPSNKAYPGSIIKASKYFREFWDYDNSDYRLSREKDGEKLSRTYMKKNLETFENNFAKAFNADTMLTDITTEMLQNIRYSLIRKGYASTTVKDKMICLLTALKDAERRGLIPKDPAVNLRSIDAKAKDRDIFTEAEFNHLISILQDQLKDRKSKYYKSALALMLCAATGARIQEILTLTKKRIFYMDDHVALLEICTARSKYDGVKSTKTKKDRYIGVPVELAQEMLWYNRQSPEKIDHIFWAKDLKAGGSITMMSYNTVLAYYLSLYGEDSLMGISEEERKDRGLTIHCLRHYYSSKMENKIRETKNKEVVKRVLGHASDRISEHYTHRTIEDSVITGFASRVLLGYDQGILTISPEEKKNLDFFEEQIARKKHVK